jgi:hypothetical protein
MMVTFQTLTTASRIFWPICTDQPGNAAFLTVKHQAAFELLSVRTGIANKPPYRCHDGRIPLPDFSLEGVKKETKQILLQIDEEEGRRRRANFE